MSLSTAKNDIGIVRQPPIFDQKETYLLLAKETAKINAHPIHLKKPQ